MKYYAIPSFIKDLNKLCKKRQNGYYHVKSDIAKVYEEVADILKVIELGDILHYVDDENQKLILKTRYPNSAMKEGKSGGFRSLSIADKAKNVLTFLTIYPKKGKFAKENIDENDIFELLEEFIEAVDQSELFEVDIKDDLKVIEEEEEDGDDL